MTDPQNETPEPSSFSLAKYFTVRNIAKTVANTSAKFVVTSTIASLVPTETRAEKAKIYVGSYVIAGVVTDRVDVFVDEKIDEWTEYVTLVRQVMKQLESSTPENETVHKITTL